MVCQIPFYGAKWYLLFATLIKAKTNSLYSHCSIQINDYIYESRILSGATKTLVNERHLKKKPKLSVNMEISKYEATILIRKLESVLGSRYDYLGAILGYWGKSIQKDKWFVCTEVPNFYFLYYLNEISGIKTLLSPKELYLKCFWYTRGLNEKGV